MPEKCQHASGCIKRASYNMKDGSPLFCFNHKNDTMIDVTRRICEQGNCTTRANYDIKGGKGRFCKSHKTHNMIDVKNRTCLKCSKRPNFGNKDGPPLYCSIHKDASMVDLCHPKCNFETCENQPTFGFINTVFKAYIARHDGCDQQKVC
jgi:hypothetical protein